VQDQLVDLAMRNKIPISIPQPEGVVPSPDVLEFGVT
jgi:hypothetical protein